MPIVDEYASRLASETNRFADRVIIHNLPGIFHYWSDTHIRPKLRALGFDTLNDLFHAPLINLCERYPDAPLRFLSIGAGNCDFELDIARALTAAGHTNFTIDCLDLNASMLQRGVQAAAVAGLGSHIAPLQSDFNAWQPQREYDAVIASQSLHHVVNLEGLFAQIKASLKPHACFIVSDIIGRNGHERWPEALEAVHHFWRRLPPTYHYNWQLPRYEDTFQDWNCASDSFEGIRAQDILPLLIEYFHFEKFAAFGNVIDPFTERSFGPNFDPARSFDRAFIDEVHAFDEQGFRDGALTPTHLFAVLSKKASAPTICAGDLSPERALRREPLAPLQLPRHPPLDFTQEELAVGHILRAIEAERSRLEAQVRAFDVENRSLKDELAARTQWALGIQQQLEVRTAWAVTLDAQVAELSAWAQSLDKHNAELTNRLRSLQSAPPIPPLKTRLRRFFKNN